MANKVTDMSKIRKVIKFHCSGKSKLFISNYLSFSRNTVKKYISLFELLGLSFEAIDAKTDAELEVLFSQNTVESIDPKLQRLYDISLKWNANSRKLALPYNTCGSDILLYILMVLKVLNLGITLKYGVSA
jgi:hypothetical protein